MNELRRLLRDDISFRPVGPILEALDTILRCPICREYFNTTMCLPCGHSFCSLCIRRALVHNSYCPQCRTSSSVSDLRKNIIVNNVVSSYVSARKEDEELSSKRKGKRVESDHESVEECEFLDGTVKCPICEYLVNENEVNDHLDNCLGRKKESTPPPKKKKRKKDVEMSRMPVYCYDIMKLKEIKKLLEDCGLRVVGYSRSEMVRLHREFVLRWNAECDKEVEKGIKRKRKVDIAMELMHLEKEKDLLREKGRSKR